MQQDLVAHGRVTGNQQRESSLKSPSLQSEARPLVRRRSVRADVNNMLVDMRHPFLMRGLATNLKSGKHVHFFQLPDTLFPDEQKLLQTVRQ